MTRVRPAVPQDAHDVARVQVRSWQWAYRGLIAQDYLDGLEPEIGPAATHSAASESVCPPPWSALVGSTICGLATTGLCRDEDLPNFGELMAIYVDPAQVGTGVGQVLMTAARERLRVVSTQAALWVLDGNVRARRFYERDGWQFDGTRRSRTYGDAPVQEVRYRRML